jgi:hypothetical protein
MGITLTDRGNEKNLFFVNFWNWRAIGEAIRTLGVVSDDRASALQEPFCGNGLTRDEAYKVADAIEAKVVPLVPEDGRLLLDGSMTQTADDGTFYRAAEESSKNYSTNRVVLLKFIEYCRSSSGFDVG